MEVQDTDKKVENLYVVKDEKIINLVRLSNIGGEEQRDEESKLTGIEKTEKKPDRLLMEILGVEKATNKQIKYLKKLFENTIMHATMLKIAIQSMMQRGLLQQQDIEYIRNSNKQCLLLFPVDNRITDRLALLHYFKATLQRRFLMPIQIQSKTTSKATQPSKPAFLHSQTVVLPSNEKPASGLNNINVVSPEIVVSKDKSASSTPSAIKYSKSQSTVGQDQQ